MTSSLIFLDRVMETTAVTSTAPYKLNGPVLGYQAFSKIGDGNTCYYAAWDGLSNWEVGLGTYTLATTTLARTTIEASSNNGSPVSWPLPNTKYIWLDFPANLAATTAALSSGTLGLPLVGQGAGVPSIYAPLPLGSGGVSGILPTANGSVHTVVDIGTLVALDTTKYTFANVIGAGGRNGFWLYTLGNFAAAVAADTLMGIYAQATGISPTIGAWVRQLFPTTEITEQMFGGGTGNPVTDGAAYECMVAVATALSMTGMTFYVAAVTHVMTKGTLLPSGNVWKQFGAIFDYSAVADTSLVPIFGTSFICMGGIGDYAVLPNLSVNPVQNGWTLDFASAHGLKARDIVCIYNPTDFSWGLGRNYYRAGEFCRTANISSSTQVILDQGLWHSYNVSDVVMYKLLPWVGKIHGGHIIGNNSTTHAIYACGWDLAADSEMLRNTSELVNYTLHIVSRSMDCYLDWCGGQNYLAGPYDGGGYGYVNSNSARLSVNNSHWVGGYHPIAHGGFDGPLCVPARDEVMEHCSATGTSLDQYAYDAHGVSEAITCRDCHFSTGAQCGTYNAIFEDCYFGNATETFSCFLVTDTKGGLIQLINPKFDVVNGPTPTITDVGVVDLGGHTTGPTQYLTEALEISVVNAKYYSTQGVAPRFMAVRGCPNGFPVSTKIDGVIFDSQVTTVEQLINSAGMVAAKYMKIDGLEGLAPGAIIASYSVATPPAQAYLPRQTGTASFASGTGTSVTNTVTFPWSYPETPTFVSASCTSPNGTNAGTNFVVPQVVALTDGGMNIVGRTNSFAAFASSVTLNMQWTAEVNRSS